MEWQKHKQIQLKDLPKQVDIKIGDTIIYWWKLIYFQKMY